MKNSKMLKKQKIRFLLYNLIAFAIIVAVLGFTAILATDRYYYADANNELNNTKERIIQEKSRDNSEPPPRDGDQPDKPDKSKNPRVSYFIYDSEKTMLVSSSEFSITLDYSDLPEPESKERKYNIKLAGYNYRIFSFSFDANSSLYYVQIILNIDGEIALRNNIINVYFICLSIIIILALISSYAMSLLTMKPVEKALIAQKSFVSDASHELRTPLTILHGRLEQLLDDSQAQIIDKSEEISDCLTEVIRLNRLTGDLLLLARSDNDKQINNVSEFDMFELINKIALPYQESATYSQKQFNIIGTSLLIQADQQRMTQALIVFFDNALKYTNSGDSIVIELGHHKNKCQITITDTGIGISPRGLKKVFDRFYRDDQSRTLIEGTGLGLAIAKQIINEHRGTINAYHNHPKGTKFIINLPLKA